VKRHPPVSLRRQRPNWRWPLPDAIRALIVQRWRGRRTNAALNNAANEYAALYHTLLEYEKTRGFPDPLIAHTNIVSYFWRLRAKNPTDTLTNRKMINAWGKDWQSKLQAEITPVVIDQDQGVLSNVRPKPGLL
jgi:hypothetical protein